MDNVSFSDINLNIHFCDICHRASSFNFETFSLLGQEPRILNFSSEATGLKQTTTSQQAMRGWRKKQKANQRFCFVSLNPFVGSWCTNSDRTGCRNIVPLPPLNSRRGISSAPLTRSALRSERRAHFVKGHVGF